MAFVAAKCTQCGAELEVDNTQEAAVCKHCGTPFIVEKAIKNYNTFVTNNNNFAGANITIQGEDLNNLLERAKLFIEKGDFKSAIQYCERALDVDAKCGNAYLYKFLAFNQAQTINDIANYPAIYDNNSDYNNALRFNCDDKDQLQKAVENAKRLLAECDQINKKGLSLLKIVRAILFVILFILSIAIIRSGMSHLDVSKLLDKFVIFVVVGIFIALYMLIVYNLVTNSIKEKRYKNIQKFLSDENSPLGLVQIRSNFARRK